MGRHAASARVLSRLLCSRGTLEHSMRLLILTAFVVAACLALGLQIGLLAPLQPPEAQLSPSPGLAVRTIVAYSLQARLRQPPPPTCEVPPSQPDTPLTHFVWQSPREDVFLLSAYLDTRVKLNARAYPMVRIVAMLHGNQSAPLFCQLWFQDLGVGSAPVISAVLPTEIWSNQWDAENYETAYRPFLLSCPVTVDENMGLPKAVSVVSREPCSLATVLLPIAPPARLPTQPNTVAVCVKGLDFEEDRSARLVEWLELNLLLGATRVLLYVYHVHPRMKRVLDYYEERGLVTVIPLSLPGNQPNVPSLRSRFLRDHIWQKRRNELVSYNDCLYRNLDLQFILPLDVDEVIVPNRAGQWKNLFKQIYHKYPDALTKYASLSIQNAYFFGQFTTGVDSSIPKYLYMLRHTERSANLSPEGQSAKSFVSTANTLTVFNHYALHALYPAVQTRLVISSELVRMHHYQERCSALLFTECQNNFLKYHNTDLSLARFKDILRPRVALVLRWLKLIP